MSCDGMIILKIQKFSDLEMPALIAGTKTIRLNKAAAAVLKESCNIDMKVSFENRKMIMAPSDNEGISEASLRLKENKPNGTVVFVAGRRGFLRELYESLDWNKQLRYYVTGREKNGSIIFELSGAAIVA